MGASRVRLSTRRGRNACTKKVPIGFSNRGLYNLGAVSSLRRYDYRKLFVWSDGYRREVLYC